MKEKRTRNELARLKTSDAPANEPETQQSPEKIENLDAGDNNQLRVARDYFDSLVGMFDEMESKLSSLQETANKASKSGVSDADQKNLNKNFQEQKKQIDLYAKQTELDKEAPFSGKFAQKPKQMGLGEGVNPIEIRIEPLHAKALGLDQLRVDSLSYAKKAQLEVARVRDQIQKIKSQFVTRLEAISARLKTLSENTESVHVHKGDQFFREWQMKELREQQERAAVAKGRTLGLLINIKV